MVHYLGNDGTLVHCLCFYQPLISFFGSLQQHLPNCSINLSQSCLSTSMKHPCESSYKSLTWFCLACTRGEVSKTRAPILTREHEEYIFKQAGRRIPRKQFHQINSLTNGRLDFLLAQVDGISLTLVTQNSYLLMLKMYMHVNWRVSVNVFCSFILPSSQSGWISFVAESELQLAYNS